MAKLAAVVTNYRLLQLLRIAIVTAAAAVTLVLKLQAVLLQKYLVRKVILFVEVTYLFQRALLLNNHCLQVLLLALRSIRAETSHVVDAYLLVRRRQIALANSAHVLREHLALVALVAEAALVVGARLQ